MSIAQRVIRRVTGLLSKPLRYNVTLLRKRLINIYRESISMLKGYKGVHPPTLAMYGIYCHTKSLLFSRLEITFTNEV